jgi:adenine-specific DNA-methyltransferase
VVRRVFAGKKDVSEQKLRGGYYTPETLSNYLCEWAIRRPEDNIFEPSCGDGNFVVSALSQHSKFKSKKKANITAVELLEREITKAQGRAQVISKNNSVNWINDDFFNAYNHLEPSSFDVVLGNPPFIRFQYFEDEKRELAFKHLREAGYHPTKLANAWAAFVQLSIELIKPGGRLAMVIPAELLQVKYAAELRKRLTQSFDHIVLVSFKKLVFKDIQQEVVLVLAEGKREQTEEFSDVHTLEIKDELELATVSLKDAISHSKSKHMNEDVKWTSLFLSEDEFKAVKAVQNDTSLKKLGDYASVDVGIVTGRNKFFVVSEETKKEFNLEKFVVPLVGRTSGINTLNFDKDKFNSFSEGGDAFLLNLKGIDSSEFTSGLIRYIELGEEEGVHTGYKCRIRKRWYDVPSTHVSSGFLFRQIHKYPLLVNNSVGARCTDTIHRVNLVDENVDFEQLSVSFVNSLSFACAEVYGRSYGGGVLELEPNESEEMPIPYLKSAKLDVEYVNDLVERREIVKALDYVDKILLIDGLGMSVRRVNLLRQAWERLSGRRINRK